jgi:hypothetical protein
MMARAVIAAICLLGLLFAWGVVVELDDITRTAGPVAVIPFKLHGSMIVVEVVVDGSDPLAFIFDTAAGGTILNERTADRLGVIGGEAVFREGATGSAEVMPSKRHTVELGRLNLRNMTLGIVALDHIERRFGLRIDGVIGWPIVSRYAVVVDYDAMQIELHEPRGFEHGSDAPGYDIEAKGTVFFVNVSVALESGATFAGKVLVDTGSGGNISFNSPFVRENNLLDQIGSSYEREMQGFSAESARSYVAMLSGLSIGRHELVGVPASMSLAEAGATSWSGVMGILGNGVLKRFNMVIDLKRRRLFLEPNRLYHEAFEVDCSGLQLVLDDALQRVIVERVIEGSPALEAGMKEGDEIVLVDGADASDLQLPGIRSLLSQDGKEVELLVDREGEQECINLRLQSLLD